jgi:signal transduction histidine kinase/ActR/RegA family two-component response regulator
MPNGETAAIVYNEQIRLILAHTAVGTGVATLFAILLAGKLGHGALGVSLPPALVVGWIVLKIAVVVPRMVHAHLCKRRLAEGGDPPYRMTVPLLALDGAVWGLGGAYLMGASSDAVSVVASVLCCVACVATFGLQVRTAAAAAYVGPMLVPVSIALLWRGDDVGLIGGLGLPVFLALLLATSVRWQHRVAEVIQLRLATEQISQERAEALALAERHSAAKDRFLAVVSHELRTPLHGILGLVQIARHELPRDQALLHYRLELIEEAARHQERMVSDLLDISAIEAGRLELKRQPVHLARELGLLRETWRSTADEIGLRLLISVDPAVGEWVVGDAVRLVQVLNNLVGNAFKFTPLGGQVALTARRIAHDQVRFDVADTGRGIAPEDLERIFEAFVQVSDGAGSRPSGVGLGLAISRELARAMGGDLSCISDVGRGATFVFTAHLPVAAAPVAEPDLASRLDARRLGSGKTVAVVDDDSSSRLVAITTLRRLGFEVEEYDDADSALPRLLTTGPRPDLVLLDWDMPGSDGGQAAEAIRTFERVHELPRLPLLTLSANAPASFAVAAREAGVDDVLLKPCTPGELAAAVMRHVGHAAAEVGDDR